MPSYEHGLTKKQERRKNGNNGGNSKDKASNIADTTLSAEIIKERKIKEELAELQAKGRVYKRESNGSWYGPISEPAKP